MNNVQTVNKYAPDYVVTPGEVLKDYLEFAGLTQSSLAERTGLSKKAINEIIKAKSTITAETALKFERTLGRPAHFWTSLERQYQEDKTRLADKMRLEANLQWLDSIPVHDMARFGWIEKFNDKVKQLEAVLRFFAIASPTQWKTIWIRDLQVSFRKTEGSKNNAGVISAWLRQGEILGQKFQCEQFNKQKFQNCLDEIRKLTVEEPKTFVPKLKRLCAEAGVAVVFIQALPRLGIYGATRWLNGKPVMQLSLYLKSNDHLWFTIFHEACHIIKHGRKELFIEVNGLDNENEKEADAFARDKLIPPVQMKRFLASGSPPTLSQIIQFSASIGIAPGIVVGRLQHDNLLPMHVGNNLKVRYEWAKE
jgi:addiction module HigA family antidote